MSSFSRQAAAILCADTDFPSPLWSFQGRFFSMLVIYMEKLVLALSEVVCF